MFEKSTHEIIFILKSISRMNRKFIQQLSEHIKVDLLGQFKVLIVTKNGVNKTN